MPRSRAFHEKHRAPNSVIIIGAGIAGLSAGIYARLAGLETRILEHHTQAGGVAAWWRRGQYIIDDGIHFIMDSEGIDVYREVGALGPGSLVPMEDMGRFMDEASGTCIETTRHLERLRSDLKRISPDDGKLIDWFMDSVNGLRGMDMGMLGFFKPPELSGMLDNVRMMWKMRGLLKFLTGRYARPVEVFARGFHSPVLGEYFKNLFLPEVPVWFVMMTLALLSDGKMSLLRNGCRDFITAMEARYRELGGSINFKSTVVGIIVSKDRAIGVTLRDGKEHRADYIISAADGRSTIFGMLGGKYVDRSVKERYLKWKTVRPMLTVSFGVARRFEGEPHYSLLLLKKPLRVAGKPVRSLTWRILNYGDTFAPRGKAILQAILETEWAYWEGLRGRDIASYNREKDRLASDILERLETVYPGIGKQVELTDVATPCTTWRYTLNHEGAWGGWLMTPELITKSLPVTLPGLSGLCMAGQWATAGGSVPGCIFSARNAVELILKWEGRKASP